MIGRDKEKKLLEDAYHSDRAEMIAVYGRRRIGKTYLIREFFKTKANIFMLTLSGQANGDMKTQVRNSSRVLRESCGIVIPTTAKWDEIFHELKTFHIAHKEEYDHFVLFIDETPWISTPKSGFIGAVGHIWNIYFSLFPNVTFILCGSAAAWMLKNIASDKGELHGRITKRIALMPFTLGESEAYLQHKGFSVSRKHVIDYYSALGGVAHYLSYLDPNKSYAQNIDTVCFSVEGILYDEFGKLFTALFGKTPHHKAVVEFLAAKASLRYSAQEIANSLKIASLATIYSVLDDLEAAGFIRGQNYYNQNKRDVLFSLCDPYSYFYLKWIKNIGRSSMEQNSSYWATMEFTQGFVSWSGNAFEMVAHNHIPQIKSALGISGVKTDTYYWRTKADNGNLGAQIDLLIKRADKTVTIVECKYYNDVYTLDSAYEKNLENKKKAFSAVDKENNAITLALLTTYGAKRGKGVNINFTDMTMDTLFS